MPRTGRQICKTKVYHITIRGIDKQNIFFDDNDRKKFLEILKDKQEQYNYKIYVYCLMDNHVHMVIYDQYNFLSKIMQSIEISYSIYFNKKYERIGHLFQNRFYNKKVESREYLVRLCRYVHQNPLKAGIETTEKYKWSSYNGYVGKSKFIDNRLILSIFSIDIDEAKKKFIEFHKIVVEKNKEQEIKSFIEYEMSERLTDKEIENNICDLLEINDIREILQYNNDIKKQKVIKLKCLLEICSISQMARIIGMNRKMIERILKSTS